MRLPFFSAAVMAVALAVTALPPAALAQQDTATAAPADTKNNQQDLYRELNVFGEVLDRIRAEYVDVPDDKALIRAAINGMLTSLDPHSSYLNPDDYKAMQTDTSGQFGGLGIEVTMQDGVIKVVSPIDGTPAAAAGILSNDLIVEIDGEQVQGMSLDEAVGKMRGAVGTKIKLTVVRDGVQDPLTFELTRDIIAEQVVHYSLEGENKDVAFIRLSRFSEQAYSGIEKAIKDVFKDLDGKAPKGIILDLRNNPGGLVDQAVAVSDAFLSQGAIVLTRGRSEQESGRYDAKPDDLDKMIKDVPLVVLINGGSASAAEIVAGALQDHKRATLIGSRSFGKGSVQSIISLGRDGAMRLTTARYYTPSNRSIQAAGIQPDIKVLEEVPPELQGKDKIIGEAALPGQIGGGTEGTATTGSSVYVPADKTKDTQLQYAIRLIEGQETDPSYPPKVDQ
ncbi:MAG TPA: S41 family peptidase [Devosiaceae bacterium]